MTPEKRETAIKWLIEEIRSLRMAPAINGCGPENWADQLEIMETCLEAVRGHETKPLTLEQLREMGGKPVWIVESPDWGHWELSEDAEDYICDRDADLYGLTYPDPDGRGGLHKLGWVAYAYPPAHIDREAWTAKWKSKESPWNGYTMVCSKCGETIKSLSGQMPFCPACGRAMTPKAWDELEKRLRG